MAKNHKSPLLKKGMWKGEISLFSAILAFNTVFSVVAQDYNYWANAPTGKTKIFTISFTDAIYGEAKSADGEVLLTTDSGKSWSAETNISNTNQNLSSPISWKADIYCSIMKTTDGGKTWLPYDEDKQQHFCGVYLKDENTGYNVATDFLNNVTNEIITHSEKNNLDSLIDHPHKCTEYFRSAEEGWALGWCIRNFNKAKLSKGEN
jgi:hypothetical protein